MVAKFWIVPKELNPSAYKRMLLPHVRELDNLKIFTVGVELRFWNMHRQFVPFSFLSWYKTC
jgi:hypothetical protein